MCGWMVTELHLGGYELVAYALVHQFSQKSRTGIYTGGVPYLAAWLQCSNETARKHLHALEEKGLIVSMRGDNNGVPYCNYQVVDTHIPKILRDTPKNFAGDTQKIKGSTPKKLRVENNNDNKAKLYTPLIPPTLAEVTTYAHQQGAKDPEGFADYYLRCQKEMQWRTKSGKPVENWKLNVIQWLRYHKNETFPKPATKMRQITDIKAYLQ